MTEGGPHLRGVVHVVFVLEEKRGGLDVVLLGGDVQRGQFDAPPRVVLEQHRHHAVVSLLQRHGEGREPVL